MLRALAMAVGRCLAPSSRAPAPRLSRMADPCRRLRPWPSSSALLRAYVGTSPTSLDRRRLEARHPPQRLRTRWLVRLRGHIGVNLLQLARLQSDQDRHALPCGGWPASLSWG